MYYFVFDDHENYWQDETNSCRHMYSKNNKSVSPKRESSAEETTVTHTSTNMTSSIKQGNYPNSKQLGHTVSRKIC